MINADEIFSKYENDVIKNINKENMLKIIYFLEKENCDFIDEIIENYLDLFTFNYDEFIYKYNKLNNKYNNNYLKEVSIDMNLLEEFYLDL